MRVKIVSIEESLISFESSIGFGKALYSENAKHLKPHLECDFEMDILINLAIGYNVIKTSLDKCQMEFKDGFNNIVACVDFVDQVEFENPQDNYFHVVLRLREDGMLLGTFLELTDNISEGEYLLLKIAPENLKITRQ